MGFLAGDPPPKPALMGSTGAESCPLTPALSRLDVNEEDGDEDEEDERVEGGGRGEEFRRLDGNDEEPPAVMSPDTGINEAMKLGQ